MAYHPSPNNFKKSYSRTCQTSPTNFKKFWRTTWVCNMSPTLILLILPIMRTLIFPTPLGALQNPGIRYPKLRCINLMDRTQLGGYLKWNTNSPSMIYEMMGPNFIWEFYTWIKNDGNCGNGLINVIMDYPLGPWSPKYFVLVLIGNITYWDDSPSYDKQG